MTLYPCPPGAGEEAHSTAARGLPHCGAERGGEAVPGMAPGGAAPEPGETCGDGSHSVAHPCHETAARLQLSWEEVRRGRRSVCAVSAADCAGPLGSGGAPREF